MKREWPRVTLAVLSGVAVVSVVAIFFWSNFLDYRADNLYRNSVVLAEKGDLYGAEEKLNQAISLEPENIKLHFSLGKILEREGDYPGAQKSFVTASKLDSRNFAPLFEAGRMAVKQGRSQEAVQYFERARRVNPAHVIALFKLADQYFSEENLEQAEQAYKEIIGIAPDEFEAYEKLGVIYTRKNQKDKADRIFNLVRQLRLKHSPDLGPETNRFFPESPRFTDRTDEGNADHINVLFKLGYHYSLEKNLDQAEQVYKEIIIFSPQEYEAYKSLGVVHFEQGRPGQAELMFEKAIKINPDSPQLYNDMGNLMLMTSRPEDAKDWFEKALAINPDYKDAQKNLDRALDRISSGDHGIDKIDKEDDKEDGG